MFSLVSLARLFNDLKCVPGEERELQMIIPASF